MPKKDNVSQGVIMYGTLFVLFCLFVASPSSALLSTDNLELVDYRVVANPSGRLFVQGSVKNIHPELTTSALNIVCVFKKGPAVVAVYEFRASEELAPGTIGAFEGATNFFSVRDYDELKITVLGRFGEEVELEGIDMSEVTGGISIHQNSLSTVVGYNDFAMQVLVVYGELVNDTDAVITRPVVKFEFYWNNFLDVSSEASVSNNAFFDTLIYPGDVIPFQSFGIIRYGTSDSQNLIIEFLPVESYYPPRVEAPTPSAIESMSWGQIKDIIR